MARKDEHEGNAEKIENAIRLGVILESEDGDLSALVGSITSEQIKWISAWLASENFGPLPDPTQPNQGG